VPVLRQPVSDDEAEQQMNWEDIEMLAWFLLLFGWVDVLVDYARDMRHSR